MESILKGKTVVITGGNRGIGFAIAELCASKGANVAIPYVGEYPAEAVEKLRGYGVKAEAYECDVSNFEVAKATCDQIIKDFGVVDSLVNNAGITCDKLILSMTEQDFDKVIAVNLKGAFNMIKHLNRNFIRNGGCIVNISSVVGLMGNAGQANYSASKAGLIGLTKTVARELASRGVTCNAVAPGFINTLMTAALTPAQQDAIKKQIPLGTIGAPEDVARAVVFFLENRYVSGEIIKVDGGMYI